MWVMRILDSGEPTTVNTVFKNCVRLFALVLLLADSLSLLLLFCFYLSLFLHLFICIDRGPLVSPGDWFQDPLRIPKSADAQISYIKWLHICI